MWTEVWGEVRDIVAVPPLRFWLVGIFSAVLLGPKLT